MRSLINSNYHLSNIHCKDFMNLHKKCTTKPHSLLVNDITVA